MMVASLLVILLLVQIQYLLAGWKYRGCYQSSGDFRYYPRRIAYERCKAAGLEFESPTIGIAKDGFCLLMPESNADPFYDLEPIHNCSDNQFHVFDYVADLIVDDCYPIAPFRCILPLQQAKEELRQLMRSTMTATIDCRDKPFESEGCPLYRGINFFPNDLRQCRALFGEVLEQHKASLSQPYPPPLLPHIPEELIFEFTMNYQAAYRHWVINESLGVYQIAIWNETNIFSGLRENRINYCFAHPPSQCRTLVFSTTIPDLPPSVANSFSVGNSDGTSLIDEIFHATVSLDKEGNQAPEEEIISYMRVQQADSKLAQYLKGRSGIIIGSTTPWVESIALTFGAAFVTTIEYYPILSQIPELDTATPYSIAKRYLTNNWTPVDFAFAFSTFEHSGLGRYGDPIDPEGDLKGIGQAHCLLKSGGFLFLSVPVGVDAVSYNAQRTYGRVRLPILLQGWELVDVIGVLDLDDEYFLDTGELCVFVLRKP